MLIVQKTSWNHGYEEKTEVSLFETKELLLMCYESIKSTFKDSPDFTFEFDKDTLEFSYNTWGGWAFTFSVLKPVDNKTWFELE